MRLAGCTILCFTTACALSHISQDGPSPTVASVALIDSGSPQPANLVQSQSHVIRISGSHFAPLPIDVMTASADLLMPTVTIQQGQVATQLTAVRYDVASQSLDATVPAGMALGTYDLEVINPSGKVGKMVAALKVVAAGTIDLCSRVTPAFGWINGRTTLEICANNANQRGLQPVPQVFLRVPAGSGAVTEVPLIHTEFITASAVRPGVADASVMTAVVPAKTEPRGADLAVGGPYDLRVLNPDGSTAILAAAFTLIADAPPVITAVTPGQSDTSQTGLQITLSGHSLKDPNASLTPRLAAVYLLSQPFNSNDITQCNATLGCYPCGAPVWTLPSQQVTCSQPSVSAAGSYVLHYQHLDDGSFGEFSAFAITNPAGNVVAATTATPLTQARMALAATIAQDDTGARFLYAVGGQSDPNVSSALSSVEVATLSTFGDVGAWRSLPVTLPLATTGLAVVSQGSYLFALGGRRADGNTVGHVWRARVLGTDTQPVQQAPALQAGGELAPGTYVYRVAAIMAPSHADNPNGESLPSDPESIVVDANHGSVQLAWSAVAGATAYRIYRSPPNGIAGSEELVADRVTDLTFSDSGSVKPTGVSPQPDGATGVWVAMPALSVSRADAGATVASDPNGALFVYLLGGRLAGSGTETATVDVASLSQAGGVWSTGSFAQGANMLTSARAEVIAVTLDAASAPRVAGLGASYVAVAQGIAGTTVQSDVLLAKVGANGNLGAFTSQAGSPSNRAYGAVGVMVSNILYTVGGQSAVGTFSSSGRTIDVCGNGVACSSTDPPVLSLASGNSGFAFTTARYRAGFVCSGGYFYALGGQSSGATVESSTDRTGYN